MEDVPGSSRRSVIGHRVAIKLSCGDRGSTYWHACGVHGKCAAFQAATSKEEKAQDELLMWRSGAKPFPLELPRLVVESPSNHAVIQQPRLHLLALTRRL
ncbi:hypothetical protein V6N13_115756 [Hibiscus sabdariffa]|uniref:Uncharacterized protein n=1 Tax=Hibiscus sabdariffa TaxID=183260 RepID=A0ABR2CV83_9ROSI